MNNQGKIFIQKAELVIINEEDFKNDFPSNVDVYYADSREIYRESLSILIRKIKNNKKYTFLLPKYKPDGIVLLDFIKKEDDVYFYKYSTTVS